MSCQLLGGAGGERGSKGVQRPVNASPVDLSDGAGEVDLPTRWVPAIPIVVGGEQDLDSTFVGSLCGGQNRQG